MRLIGLVLGLLWGQGLQAVPPSDGPYVFTEGDERIARWICDGEVRERPVGADGQVEAVCGSVPALTLSDTTEFAPDSLPQPERWAALSDIHGQAGLFLQLLQAHGLVDAAGHWDWADGVLVITGDVLDRGPAQIEALWAIYRLAQEAAAAGGRVELLLGNHEAMVMAGDLRYLHPKYPAVARLLGRASYDQLLAADTELGAWLRRRATVLKLGDTLFMHGGLHPDYVAQGVDLTAINRRFRNGLGKSRARLDPASVPLFGNDGPLWYRGYFHPLQTSTAQIQALLDQAAVARIVVGHTTQSEIRSLHDGRIIAIDAGLKTGADGELLLHDADGLWRGLLDGRRLALTAER
jgi:hypothetical protein